MHAKAKGAYNLDKASRGLQHLEHFVMWSSFVASAGNEGEPSFPNLGPLPLPESGIRESGVWMNLVRLRDVAEEPANSNAPLLCRANQLRVCQCLP